MQENQKNIQPIIQNKQSSTQQQPTTTIPETTVIDNKTNINSQKPQNRQLKQSQNIHTSQNKNNQSQDTQNKKEQTKVQKQSQMKQQKQQNTDKNNGIYTELLDMGFQQYLIKQALKITTDKDKAIQYIISSLQNEQKILQKTKQKNKQKQMNMQQKKFKKQGQKQKQKVEQGMQAQDQEFEDVQQDCKMIFLVRMDLKMGLGKIAAQVAHATLKAYKQMEIKADKNQIDQVNFFQWMQGGQKKIVVKVNDEKQLIQTVKKAQKNGINSCYIRDAGLTQVASGSITVAALGPAPSSQIDALTKHFKLL